MKWTPKETSRQQKLIKQMQDDVNLERRLVTLTGESDAEFDAWARGAKTGALFTASLILALGAAVRIGVAIWEMVR